MKKQHYILLICLTGCCAGSAYAANLPDGIYDLYVGGEKQSSFAVVEKGQFVRPVTVGTCVYAKDATGTVRDKDLLIDVPEHCMASRTLDMRADHGPLKFVTGNSWYFNASTSTTDGERPNFSIASGLYLDEHYLYSDAYLDARYGYYNRGQSRVGRDIPEIDSRLTAGDITPDTGSGLLDGKQLGGIQFARNWAQNPDRAATVYYTSSRKLKLSSRSMIEFSRDGQIVDRRELSAGEYDIRNLPAAAYASTLKLRITDAFGAVSEITIEIINPPRILSKGAVDYNLFVGWERTGYVAEGEYRTLTGGGYVGYGVTNWLSVFGSLYDTKATGAASVATPIGLLLGEMHLDSVGDYRAAYSYSWRNVGLGAEYRQVDKKGSANASASLGLDEYGSVSARFISGDAQSYGLSHSISLPWAISALSTIDFARTGAVGYSAGFIKQWTNHISTQLTYTKGLDHSDSVLAQLTFTLDRAKPTSVGLQASSTTRDGQTAVQAKAEALYGIYGSVATFTQLGGKTQTTGTVAASVACAGGHCRVGEPISTSFAIGDNVESVGQKGSVLSVAPYNNTTLSASTRTTFEQKTVALRPGQGVYISAADLISVQGMVTRDGKPVKSVSVTWKGGRTITGEDGLLWISGLRAGQPISVSIDGTSVILPLDGEPDSGILDVGSISISSTFASAK